MTYTDWRNFIGQVRYRFSELAKKYVGITKNNITDLRVNNEYLLKTVSMYLDVLEDYFMPVKIVGTASTGGTIITLKSSIIPTDYTSYVGHIITGTGIPANTKVLKIDENYVYLSTAVISGATDRIYTIGVNCITCDQFNCIIDHINRIFNAQYCIDCYWTEFDIDYITPQNISTSELPYMYGDNFAILTADNIYASLSKVASFDGSDTNVDYNFSNKRAYFAYPASFGNLSSILDQEVDEVISNFSVVDLDVVGPSEWGGITYSYRVYYTHVTSILGHTYKFKF